MKNERMRSECHHCDALVPEPGQSRNRAGRHPVFRRAAAYFSRRVPERTFKLTQNLQILEMFDRTEADTGCSHLARRRSGLGPVRLP